MENPALFTIKDLLFGGNQDPDHPALESSGCPPLTFRDLRERIPVVVKTLNAMGYHRNDRIAVILPEGPATAVMVISAMAGFTCIPLNPRGTAQEYGAWITRLGIQAVVVMKGSETAARPAAAKQNIRIIELVPGHGKAGMFHLEPPPHEATGEAEFSLPSDTATLVMTSGTTTSPRVIPYSQKLMCENARMNREIFRYSAGDRCLQILPCYHLFGLTALLYPLTAGATVICTSDFIPADFFPLLQAARPTCYGAVPAIHQAICTELKKIPAEARTGISLRFMVTGSSFLPDTIRQELEAMLKAPVIEVYGMSEALYLSVNNPYRSGSVGIPVIESLIITDENGNALVRGKEGEIAVRGKRIFSGYENAPEENAAAFSGGWFRTGDLGYIDADGYLFITGRAKELINKGGEKISPGELDLVLCSHPGVREAMAFPVKDPLLGEDVAVMIVRNDESLTEDGICRYLLDRVAPFKIPRRIWFVDAIPKTPSGKPLRSSGTQRYS